MKKRTYTGEADLLLLQEFNAAAIAVTNHCGYLHPGDIPHHIYNGNKYYDPAEIMTIWEDDQGVAAWLLVGPRHKSYDAQVRPDLRGNDFEREILAYADDRTIELMRRHDIAGDCIYGDAFRGDAARVQLLSALGWEADDELPYVLNRTEINSTAVPTLPEGFSFQSAKGIEDAAALAEVHNAAFGAGWTPELYRQVMEAPGYAPERELGFVNLCLTVHNLPKKRRIYDDYQGNQKDRKNCRDPVSTCRSIRYHQHDVWPLQSYRARRCRNNSQQYHGF